MNPQAERRARRIRPERPNRIGPLPRVSRAKRPPAARAGSLIECAEQTYRVLAVDSVRVEGRSVRRLLVQDTDGTAFVLGEHRLRHGPWKLVGAES